VYLFLRNKVNAKAILRTENLRQNKRFYRIGETENWNEMAIIKRIGEIYSTMFFKV
jgi:hypothetical protein